MIRLTILTISLLMAGSALGATINVPADQPTIQAGIDAALDGDEVVVAQGEYFEAIDFLGKAITVRSIDPTDSVVVLQTIINGGGAFDHVVQCVSGEGPDTVLSGFVITGGSAGGIGVPPDEVGGGMYNEGSSPTITNCSFSGNSAPLGSGMYNNESSPTISNCSFSGNSWGTGGGRGIGGGMYNRISSPTITNCSFSGNGASSGGGMYNSSSSPTVTNCSFGGNNVFNGGGGGMYNLDGNPTISDCSFSGNTSLNGGSAMYNDLSSATITNCLFSGNHAGFSGGGMYNTGPAPTVTDCFFSGNSAGSHGGGIYNDVSNPTITTCSFSANTADEGGGMYNLVLFDVSPTVTNTGFCSNVPDPIFGLYDDGGGVSLLYCAPLPPPAAEPATCPADLDGDGTVGPADLAQLLGAWGACV